MEGIAVKIAEAIVQIFRRKKSYSAEANSSELEIQQKFCMLDITVINSHHFFIFNFAWLIFPLPASGEK